jgi:hypothetical protein
MLKVVAIALGIIAIQANAVCGTQIVGAKTAEDARQRAAASLAIAINSKLSFHSKSEEIIDGRKSSQKDTTIQKIDSKLLNAQAAKYEDGKNENGYFSKACMPNENAAKPYLDSLRYFTDVLKGESCKSVNETYKSINDLENILNGLQQMNSALKNEYGAVYAKAKEVCEQPVKGIYVESSNSHFESKISSFLTDHGCVLAEKEKAALYLKLDVKECEQQIDDMKNTHCRACIKIELGGKSIYKDSFTSSKESWNNMETACKRAVELSVTETWNKLKGPINKGGCK